MASKRTSVIPSAYGDEPADEDRTQVVRPGEGQPEAEASGGGSTAYLIVLSGSNVGETFRIDHDEMVVGRGSDASIRLNDAGVSRRHARVIRRDGQLLVEDLGSVNGTLVNEAFVTQHVLQDGDKIRLGSITILKFTFHDKLDERFQRQMFEAALRDGLTKAYNKRYLLTCLDTEFAYARRHKTPLSVLMFDVDHFKKLNDAYGHVAGDAVLVQLARLAQMTLRAEDVFARYGGEEFMVVCRNCSLGEATPVAERLRALVEGTSFEHDGTRLPVTVSVGVASLHESAAQSATALVAAADEALYAAKRGGRNCVRAHRAS